MKTTFKPGNTLSGADAAYGDYFVVTFSGSSVTWTLTGPDGDASTVTASASGRTTVCNAHAGTDRNPDRYTPLRPRRQTIPPTATPTVAPTATPTVVPTATPTPSPTPSPTATPTVAPTATATPSADAYGNAFGITDADGYAQRVAQPKRPRRRLYSIKKYQ